MRDLLFSLVMLGLLPYALMRPYIGLLVWVWLSFMSPYRLTYGFAYSFPWVQIIAIITLAALVIRGDEKRRWMPSTGLTWLLVAFLACSMVTTFFAVNRELSFPDFERFTKTLIMVFMILILVNDRIRLHGMICVIAASIGFYGVKGGLFTLAGGGQEHVLGPAASFISGNNEMALALVMTIPLIRYLQLQYENNKWLRRGFGIALVLCVVSVFGTYSRGGFIALAVTGFMLILKTRRRLYFIASFAIIVPIAVLFMPATWVTRMESISDYKTVQSAQSRIVSWRTAVNIALARPLVGGGFNAGESREVFVLYSPPDAKKPRAIHSIFFQALGTQGFTGLFIFLGLLWTGWSYGNRVRRLCKPHKELKWAYDQASMLQVSLVGYLTAGAFAPMTYFDYPYSLLALLACLWFYVKRLDPLAEVAKPKLDNPVRFVNSPGRSAMPRYNEGVNLKE